MKKKTSELPSKKIKILKKINSKKSICEITFENLDIYTGELTNNEIEGSGELKWKNGNHYKGQFKNGLRHGKGIFISHSHQLKYTGNFYKGVRNGLGKITYNSGSSYEGFFNLGQKEGKGIFIYKSKNFYIGDWKKDLKNGFGKIYWQDQKQIYKGYWKDNHQEGLGYQIWEENPGEMRIFNNRYIGFYKKGKREGLGIFYYSNGEIYIGDWLDDKKHGFGIHRNQFGQEKEVFYIENNLPEDYKKKIEENILFMNGVEEKEEELGKMKKIKNNFLGRKSKFLIRDKYKGFKGKEFKGKGFKGDKRKSLKKKKKKKFQKKNFFKKDAVIINIYKNILNIKGLFYFLKDEINFDNLNVNLYVF